MGNYFGIDSILSIDETIANMLYQPPDLNHKLIENILQQENINSFDIISNNLKINVLEIQPEYFKIKYKKIIIFSHGNACDNFIMFDYLNNLTKKLGIMISSYDYPQYGLSTGKLNEKTCSKSLKMVIDHYLKLEYEITLVAQSIGNGMLIDFVSNNNWKKSIMLISPYMSIPSIIVGSTTIDSCIINNRYASIDKIGKVKCKVKIFHGKDDKLINISHAKYLYKILPNKSLTPTWLNNCHHNNILEKITINDYLEVINESK
jgi:hypothetical protein